MPAAWLGFRWAQNELGANPVGEALNASGELALKSLLLCLACTPLRVFAGLTWPMKARKHLGLLAAAYAGMHAFLYVGVDHYGEWSSLIGDMLENPFIIVGSVAATLLVPLTVTSFQAMRRRLKPRTWVRLHQLVYVIGVLAIVHFVMRAKKDATEAWLHGAVLAVLLGLRVVDSFLRRSRRSRAGLPTD